MDPSEVDLQSLEVPATDRDIYKDGEEESCFPSAAGDSEKTRVGRHPRWSRNETLILIEAKRVEEAKWSKLKEERERGIETCRSNSDSKWLSIAQFCERMGSIRSASQCRKRWCNLSADYKRIRDWESRREKQSFWFMSNDVRKENKLPGCFDREVFDSIDKWLGIDVHCSVPEVIFDSGRQAAEDGLFSDIQHTFIEEEKYAEKEIDIDSPIIESLASSQARYEEKMFSENFSMEAYEDVLEEEPDILPGKKKRKRQPDGGVNLFSKELCSLLENSSEILTSHMNSQNMNCHLDRAQRKEHMDSLVHVLGRLAQAFGKIAEKI